MLSLGLFKVKCCDDSEFAVKHLFIFVGFCVSQRFRWSALAAVAEEGKGIREVLEIVRGCCMRNGSILPGFRNLLK